MPTGQIKNWNWNHCGLVNAKLDCRLYNAGPKGKKKQVLDFLFIYSSYGWFCGMPLTWATCQAN